MKSGADALKAPSHARKRPLLNARDSQRGKSTLRNRREVALFQLDLWTAPCVATFIERITALAHTATKA
jgi:hypothetical protein